MTDTPVRGSPIHLQTQTPGAVSTNSIMLSGEAMCLGIGAQSGSPSYVSVVRAAAGKLPQWRLQYLGPNPEGGSKYYVGTEDGQFWWKVPSDSPLENCVSLVAGQKSASTIIIIPNGDTYTLEGAYAPGQYMAPIGFAKGFYFATDQAASAPVVFLAIA